MNALFLLHNHLHRGSYFRAYEIARRLARNGYEIHFAFTSETHLYRPRYHESLNSITLAEMPCFTFFNSHQEGWSLFDSGWRLRDAFSRKWDLVYAFSHKPCCILPAFAAKLRGARLILDWADWWGGPEGLYQHCVIPSSAFQSLPHTIRIGRRIVYKLESSWEGRIYSQADIVTLTSSEFLKHPRAPKNLADKSIIIHSGSPIDQIHPVDKETARSACSLKLPSNAIVFGYMANFHMDEQLLMEAFALACRHHPDIHLIIAGAPLDYATPAQHAATAGRIHHLGWLPFSSMTNFLGAADILLLPLTDVALNRARYPHKLSDYLAAGRPLIACNTGETGRLFRLYGLNSLTTPDPEAFSREILQQTGKKSRWDNEGYINRMIAEKHFNWDVILEPLLARIDTL